MPDTPRGSISRRLIGVLVLVALLILCNMALFGWLIFRSLSEQELNRIMSQTRAEAEELAEQLAGEVEAGGDDLLSAIVRRQDTQTYIDRVLSKRETVATVRFYDSDGTMLFENIATTTEVGEPPDLPEDAVPFVETTHFEDEAPYELFEVPYGEAGSYFIGVPVGEVGTFVIGLSQPELNRRIRELRGELIRQSVPIAVLTVVLLLTAYVLILWLVSRSRRLEGRARDAERMAYIGTLASGLAHEIRSPLNSLNLNMQMLEEEDGEEGSPTSRRRLLAITRSEITRLENLVTNFLSYARPRALQVVDVRAVDLLEHLRDVLAVEMQSEGIELTIRDQSQAVRVSVDPDQMNQVLLNLARNAISAVAGRDDARIDLRVESLGAEAILVVEDNGDGMSDEQKEKAFDLFYSTRKGGTGLGLAIARRVALAHRGKLEIRSSVGAGTSVRLWLPSIAQKRSRPGRVLAKSRPVAIDPSTPP